MKTTTWNIDTSHSSIAFSVRHMVFAKVRGRFDSWKGAVQLDDADLTRSSVEVEIDAGSINTGTPDRDTHLRSPDFFDAEQFPTLRFESTLIEKTGDDAYRVQGNLTIRDITHEVVLETEHGGRATDPWGNQRMAFTASTSVNRNDFGLKWNQVLEAGGVLVGERIDIQLEVQAVQAAASEAA
jgi:polyisoprenoid-binding protein YceI